MAHVQHQLVVSKHWTTVTGMPAACECCAAHQGVLLCSSRPFTLVALQPGVFVYLWMAAAAATDVRCDDHVPADQYSILALLLPAAVHFWAPAFKWGITFANIADMKRPADKISTPQQCGESVDITAGARVWLVFLIGGGEQNQRQWRFIHTSIKPNRQFVLSPPPGGGGAVVVSVVKVGLWAVFSQQHLGSLHQVNVVFVHPVAIIW